MLVTTMNNENYSSNAMHSSALQAMCSMNWQRYDLWWAYVSVTVSQFYIKLADSRAELSNFFY
jgi:hypothetical protein